MKNKKPIINLSEIIDKYELLIIDIWGVVYDGFNPYDNVVDTINILNKNKKITFLSNTPRPGDITLKKLNDFGININKEQIYTSGDAIREQLLLWNDELFKSLRRKFYHLGSERNKDILSNIKVQEVDDINHADFILLTAYIDQGEDLSQFDDLLMNAKNNNIPLICANPDLTVSNGSKIRYCAGTFAKRYSDIGGIVYYYGKPDIKIYNKIFQTLNIDKSKILMIGDTIETDIAFANEAKIDSLLVLTGNGKSSYEKISDEIRPTWIFPILDLTYMMKSNQYGSPFSI